MMRFTLFNAPRHGAIAAGPSPVDKLEKDLIEMQLDVDDFLVETEKFKRISEMRKETHINWEKRAYRRFHENQLVTLVCGCAARVFIQVKVMGDNLIKQPNASKDDLETYLAMRANLLKNLVLAGVGDDPTLIEYDKKIKAKMSEAQSSVPVPANEVSSRGIKNIGNFCYIAAVAQVILESKTLKSKVMGEITQKTGEKVEEFEERKAIHKALKDFLKVLLEGRCDETLQRALRDAIFANKYINADLRSAGKERDPKTEQQDAASLILLILAVIDYSFESEIRWWVKSINKRPQPIVKPRHLLELEMQKGKNLQDLIHTHFSVTTVKDPANKRDLVVDSYEYGLFEEWKTHERIKSGDVCVVQLKRFGNDLQKITDPVFLRGHIDISKAYDDGNIHIFNLIGCVRHNGTLKSGHYTAHVRSVGEWLEYNDEIVTHNAATNDESISQNYLLFFERHDLS